MITRRKEPLAYSYMKDGRIHYLCDVPYWGEFRWSVKPGYDIVNFSWYDKQDVAVTVLSLLAYYEMLKKDSDDRKLLAKELFLFLYNDYLLCHSFLTIYYIALIRFLVDQDVDLRVFSVEPNQQEEGADYCDAAWDQGDFIEMLLPTIQRHRTNVYLSLLQYHLSIEENENCTLPTFMRMIGKDPAFSEDWRTSFVTVCRSTEAEPEEYIQMTALDTAWDVIRHSMFMMISQNVYFKHCDCCGCFFIPQGRSDAIYCDRPNSEHGGEPCNRVGAQQTAKEKRKEDPIENIYRKAYKRMYQRMDNEYITFEKYETWLDEAKHRKELCVAGEITLEAFEQWIDETSRQKKKTSK